MKVPKNKFYYNICLHVIKKLNHQGNASKYSIKNSENSLLYIVLSLFL